MSDEFELTVTEINPAWTKKKILKLLKEAEKRETLYLRSRQTDIEKVAVQFKSAAMNFIAKLPTELLNKPYFEGMKQYEESDGRNLLDQLVCEAKKRSRMEWEDSVKTLTGKRLCRVAEDERRHLVASTPMTIPENEILTTLSMNQTKETTTTTNTPIKPVSCTTRTIPSRVTRSTAAMMNAPSTTSVCKSAKPHPVRRLSREMRERLLAKYDRNDTQLSASELDYLQNLIDCLQEFKSRCDQRSKRK